ncbi:MAG TPA: hypothetical protein VGZ03_07665 [Acidimicrobiales bacterium]|nr:hypothetical protein [Acidimicrobiales bacterium]
MTTTAPARADARDESRETTLADRLVGLGWVRRYEWALLLAVAAVGAVARAGGFSSGTLYRDDAWVALTTRVPLGTAARMVVTTPGFVLGERVWIGWFPHALWADQLPTFLASVAGIVVVGRLARWWGLSAPAALVAAGVVALAYSDVQYATRVKPYAFDLLGACLVLFLAERVRRHGPRGAVWLAGASVAVCAISLTPVPLVLGVWVALGVEAVVRRTVSVRLVAAGAATALGLAALWLAVRAGISPRLRTSWDGYYLVVSSPHGFAHSARTILDGLVRGVGVTTPSLGIHGLGTLDRVALCALFLLGLLAWRRQLLSLAVLGAAVVCSIPSLVPLGTGRTDAYLYPAIAMVLAEGAAIAWRWTRRTHRALAVVALCVGLGVAGLLAADRVVHRQGYPGGDFAVAAGLVHRGLAQGDRVVIGGTARWPWSYYDVRHVRIVHSDLYNNGYTTLSDRARVIVVPGTAIEGGYLASSRRAAVRVRNGCPAVLYVESDDWPSMPATLLRQLTTTGGLAVVSHRVVAGYQLWALRSAVPCPLAR